ncbi:histidine decarboxylase [Larkinella arboricola]|uniref:Histidine decarboxylase n=1 Tax=Larkinella arboricola TaxID=643671 RepID=A0A327WPB0_LARAB|nr:histidine decarboxylase [Larkinella arboricola]RAJ94054.1 histidine decarboxylase [Larkinella arboricola]
MTVKEVERLQRYKDLLAERSSNAIGYPFALDFDFSELHTLFQYHINNVGDPYIESNYDVNSHSMEREVVEFFADLFRAPKHNRWGYVTSGGSEGNLYGLYVARELYPEAVIYYSAATHYSISKSIRLLNMPSCMIRIQPNGEMDYKDLEESIKRYSNRPAIVVANIGTTMTEAKDDVPTIRSVLQKAAVKSHYIHCDAALSGSYLAVLEEEPQFDFANGVDSIACSGHKFIGSPFPCGVVVIKDQYKERVSKPVSYIGSFDSTIAGSRNGHSPVFMWYAIKQQGREGLLRRALECLSLAEYTQRRLQEHGIAAWRNEKAITVVFPKPSASICRKWQLATNAGQAHLICMPGISQQRIDDFIEDLLKETSLIAREPTHSRVFVKPGDSIMITQL